MTDDTRPDALAALPIYCTGGCDVCRDYARELGVPFIVPPPPVLTPAPAAESGEPELPPHTRLILASEDLLDHWGARTERGERITMEWGERQPEGWYEPVFTVHHDEARAQGTDAAGLDVERLAKATARVVGWTGPLDYHREWATKVLAAIRSEAPDGEREG